jgi:hypothetical protein
MAHDYRKQGDKDFAKAKTSQRADPRRRPGIDPEPKVAMLERHKKRVAPLQFRSAYREDVPEAVAGVARTLSRGV